MTLPAPLTHLAYRFDWLLDRVIREVGDRLRRWPAGAKPGLIPPARLILIQAWLFRRRRAVKLLIGRFADGTLRPPRPYRPRPRRPDAPDRPPRMPPPAQERIPTRFGWLTAMADEVRRHGVWLGELAAEPEMKALAAATPQTGRFLRPLLRALGEEVPEWLRAPPRPGRERPPRPPRPPRATRADEADPLPPLARRYGTVRRWRNQTVPPEEPPPDPPQDAPAKVAAVPTPPATPPPARPQSRPRGAWRNVDMSR